MVVVMGKGVQVSPVLELEEQGRVKVQIRILPMAPADTRVLALEEQLGGDRVVGGSRNIIKTIGSGEVEAASDFS